MYNTVCNSLYYMYNKVCNNFNSSTTDYCVSHSSNSEASASELQENLEEMFPRYHMNREVFSSFKSSINTGV